MIASALIVAAMALGGGGSPNPVFELTLQTLFVVAALIWIWFGNSRVDEVASGVDPLVLVLIGLLLLIPLIQLIPLPPSVWTTLPGRQNMVDALDLVGGGEGWRPLSLVPRQTLAGLVAIVPVTFVIYAVAKLIPAKRRLVIGTIAAMAVLSAIFGAAQLASNGTGFYFYSETHDGWLTGFQANRNAEADVLLIGLLCLSAFSLTYLPGGTGRLPLSVRRRTAVVVFLSLALFLVTATAMTGSRMGILLMVPSLLIGAIILSLRVPFLARIGPGKLGLLTAGLIGLLTAAFLYLKSSSSFGRVAERFTVVNDARANVWEDSWFALSQYWPAGFGIGGFRQAILPAERLEVLDQSLPNRAHNDYLELALEAGIPGLVILAACVCIVAAMAVRAWRKMPQVRPQIILALGVLFLAGAHSTVDYPFRSMAVACLVGACVGLLAIPPASRGGPGRNELSERA